MLAYLDNELTDKEKRRTIKYMKQYKTLDAIIQSKELELLPSHTVEFREKPTQRSNQFHSEAEEYAIKSEEVEHYKRVKRVLDIAYRSTKPLHQVIWNEHFIDDLADVEVFFGRGISKRTYYKEKNELIKIVAECLRVAQIST